MTVLRDSNGITENDQVESWRLHVLLEANYPIAVAVQLAAAAHIDLHQAVELIAEGCNPELAAAILL